MKKEYNVIGLDCGHCALTLEKYIASVKGVNSANINFATGKLFLDIDENNSGKIIKEIIKLSKQVNPDVKINESVEIDNNINVYDIMLYVFGIILGVVSLFIDNVYLEYSLLILGIILVGYKTYIKAILQIIKFRFNENTLITISIIGAILLGENFEALMVIALYTLGKMLESKAVNYSRKSISSLIATHPEFAVLLDGENEKKVKPEVVKVGDIIIIKAGEKVALDGVIIEGSANVDNKHLTGESDFVLLKVGDNISSGSIVIDSTIKVKVTNEYKDSAIAKILNLVSNATSRKSKTESFISKFSQWYTIGVIILSFITFGISWMVLKDISIAFYRGLIFLVVSCPCAFAISVPLSYFSGIGRCSKEGILIKGSNFLDNCSKINLILLDKTGTLTSGQFGVCKIVAKRGVSENELLEMVVAGEENSLHPIAKTICNYYGKKSSLKIKNFKEISGKGIEYKIGNDKFFVGRTKKSGGKTIVEVIKNNKEIGKIYLQDEVKDCAKDTITELKSLKVNSMMLTGDSKAVAKSVAKAVGIENFKSELLPEDKYKILEERKNNGEYVAFVGDGINDAPALVSSHVGISMGIMGSPATIDASDVVIADDNISKIPTLIKISRKTKRIVLENILFAGITKLTFLLLGALGITGMLMAVFADVGVTLLAILNSLRILTYKNK